MRTVNHGDRTFYVYVMSNRSRTLYIGMTNNLMRRVYEHRHPQNNSFTARYQMTRLVYAETFSEVRDAIAYEKQLKGWTRARKLELIEASNPDWRDLAEEWLGPTLKRLYVSLHGSDDLTPLHVMLRGVSRRGVS